MIYDDLRVIPDVYVKLLQAKTLWKKRIDHERPCETECTLVSMDSVYSTEITPYRSWFLEYKLARVNSVLHGRLWWTRYFRSDGRAIIQFLPGDW